MTRPLRQRYDLRWRRDNVAGLMLLCAVAGGVLTPLALGRRLFAGANLPMYPARVESATERIDPNTARCASLRRLPGIGEVLAQAIVDYRRPRPAPAFRRPEDLDSVRGIGPGKVRSIAPYLKFPAGNRE